MLKFAGSDVRWVLYLFVLEALSDSKDEKAIAFMEKYAASSGQSPEDVRRHFKRLVDTETRDEEIANPGIKTSYLGFGLTEFYYMLGDDRFWDVFAESVVNNNPDLIVTMIMVHHNPVFLNDMRFRKWADERGFTAFWSKHGHPDFCDGSLRSWVCEIGEASTTQ